MKVYFWKKDKVVYRETDAIDISSKRYVIRIRGSGITIIRRARPLKGKPEEIIYDKNLTITS